MHQDSSHLDGQYAAFGAVTDEEGLRAVDFVAGCETGAQDRPKTQQKIKSVRVETFGQDYPFSKLPGRG